MIVVDASVAAKWILEEEHSRRVEALLSSTVRSGQAVVAPPLLISEVTNILRQRMRGVPPLPRREALELLTEFLAFPFGLMAPAGLHERALILADNLGLPAVYDAHYLALAHMLDCELWTDDRRLIRQVAAALPFVRWIGDHDSDLEHG